MGQWDHTYCVVDDILSDEFDEQGMPIPTGRIKILFDGGFDREACERWMEEHPDQCTSYGTRIESFPEPESPW